MLVPLLQVYFLSPASNALRDIGIWMSVNSAGIYNTQASPFKHMSFGNCTQQPIPGGTRLYFHVINWPADGKLVLPSMGNTITKAYTLAEKTNLKNFQGQCQQYHQPAGHSATALRHRDRCGDQRQARCICGTGD